MMIIELFNIDLDCDVVAVKKIPLIGNSIYNCSKTKATVSFVYNCSGNKAAFMNMKAVLLSE